MPALERAIGVEGTIDLHRQIVASIPPEEMAQTLPLMLPAMNIDDRTDVLGGMQQAVPPEVFAGVWTLAKSALDTADSRALGRRLGVA
jgi:hypothetical protein